MGASAVQVFENPNDYFIVMSDPGQRVLHRLMQWGFAPRICTQLPHAEPSIGCRPRRSRASCAGVENAIWGSAMGDRVVTTPIAPTIGFVGCEAAIEWLQQVLDFEVTALFRDADGMIPHAQLAWRGGAINVCDTTPEDKTGPVSVALTAEDRTAVDVLYERAVAARADVQGAPEEAFTGHYRFQVRDSHGNRWNVGTAWINSDKALSLPQRVV